MKKLILSFVLLPLVSGCLLSPAPPAPEHWVVRFEKWASCESCAKHRGGTVRIGRVEVRAPYSGERLAVLRPDGTVAFDAYNTFAKVPVALIEGATYDLVEASGVFDHVIVDASSAEANYYLELVVTELALDCRTVGTRKARVELIVTLLDGSNVVSCVRNAGEAEAGDDFSTAFSSAFTRALMGALAR